MQCTRQKSFVNDIIMIFRFLKSVLFILMITSQAVSQDLRSADINAITIEWEGVTEIKITDTETFAHLSFKNAVFPYDAFIPVWHKIEKEPIEGMRTTASLNVIETTRLTELEAAVISGSDHIGSDFILDVSQAVVRKEHYVEIYLIPVRRLSEGVYERLVTFSLIYDPEVKREPEPSFRLTKSSSVLASGDWYKLRVSRNGIHRLTYDDLSSIGLAGQNAANIQLYGMGGAMLPERAGASRPDGLQEIAIMVFDGGDGSIDPGDYILFYAEGAGKWVYDSSNDRFFHQTHHYDDYNYYFITKGSSPGLRISTQTPPSGNPTHNVTTFRDYTKYAKDSINLIKSGRVWVGEEFNIRTNYSFTFNFPNIDNQTPVEITTSLVARSLVSSYFTISSGNNSTTAHVQQITSGYNHQYAYSARRNLTFNTSGNTIPVSISYNKPLSSSIGWLNYIEINLGRSLIMSSNQIAFRQTSVTGAGNIAMYSLGQANASTVIWDVTDPFVPEIVSGSFSGNTYTFTSDASVLREFIAFNGQTYYPVALAGRVANQDLRSVKPVEMIIVSHIDFLDAAKRLANIHETKSGLSCMVVTPMEIYNDFSSGKQDPAAIRDFIKLMYDAATSPGDMPRYLLLFGDGSYDNKNRLSDNTNFIPTFQSAESFHPANTFVIDDFYGLLDDNEGVNGSGHLDIGIGRFPVRTPLEASQMVDKVERYISDNTYIVSNTVCDGVGNVKPLAGWRNTICIVTDDGDGNLHIDQGEFLSNYIDNNYPVYNINKIYIDAYQQVSIAGGHRYPDVNEDINRQMEMGALIVNYIGHGGELGWAEERILRIDDIMSWSNLYQMPLFITATCEFSRFDNPKRVSAGELAFLKSDGGPIALFTTTRLAFASQNYNFNSAVYRNVFQRDASGNYYRLGDIFRIAKIEAGSSASNRNIVILGDPALKLAYPKYNVVTTHINENPVSTPPDTLKALSKVNVKGYIADNNNQVINDFEGFLYPTVYDKKVTFRTLGNKQQSIPRDFWMQKNALYKGKVSINNGHFNFSFFVPKDIAYAFGNGKISYYAEDGKLDAHGYFDQVIVGGTADSVIVDNEGPEIRLFLNDSSFVFGGTTDADPVLIAYVKDEHGINTTGSGIGHDIVAKLAGENTEQSIVLNQYYESDLDSYNSGTITYGFNDLEDGTHSLSLKVWDIFNNSSEAYTEFIVASSKEPVLSHVLNYPNPFTTYTEFWFEHNQPCCDIDVKIEVFTISGRVVKTIQERIPTVGFRAEPIPWDGLDDYGDRLARGVYVYKVTIRNEELKSAEKYEKLVILR